MKSGEIMKGTLLIIVLLMLTAGAFAQMIPADWQIAEPVVNSVRASAMGHTEMFGAQDGSAMFSNPAWMADTHDLNVEAGLATLFGSIPHEDTGTGSDITEKYTGSLKPEYAVASMPLRIHHFPISIAVGAGIWTMHRPGWDYELTSTGDFGTTTMKDTYDGLIQVAGPAVAADLFDMLYAGLSMGTATGGSITVKNTLTDPTGEIGTETSYTPSFQVVTLSAVLRPNDHFKIGLMLRPGYEMTFGEVSQKDINSGYTQYPSNSVLSMPDTYGASFSLTSSDRMVELIGEYQSRQLSKIQFGIEGTELDSTGLDNGEAFRLGLQLGAIQVGYFLESVAVPEDLEGTKPATHKGFTFGLGYRGHRIGLFAYGEYGTLEYKVGDPINPDTQKEKIWRVGGGIGIHLF